MRGGSIPNNLIGKFRQWIEPKAEDALPTIFLSNKKINSDIKRFFFAERIEHLKKY